jgi:hypothetical protein
LSQSNEQASEEEIEEIRNRAACSIKTVIHRTDTREEDRAGESIKKGLVVNVGMEINPFSLPPFPILTLTLFPLSMTLCLSPLLPLSRREYQISRYPSVKQKS